MTDTRTDLPSREETLERMRSAMEDMAENCSYRAEAALALDSLTLLDLAAEMQRRGASVMSPDRAMPEWEIRFPAPPQDR